MSPRGGRLALAAIAGVALALPAVAQARGTGAQEAVIVRVRASPMPLLPVARSHVASRLRARARRDQSALLQVLRAAVRRGEASAVESLWIDDTIAVRARPELLARLRRRADVRSIRPDRALALAPAALTPQAAPATPGTGVAATGAPELWAQGQTGRGAVVAVLDTGLAPGFAQLSAARGAWFDPYGEHPAPFDDDARGHGTEVTEVVVAMAPDVTILAGRVFGNGGHSTTSAVHRVFQWVLDPDGNPATDDAPHVVNGSWDDGSAGRCESEFDADIAALRAAGIVPVFAAGNAGPRPNTAGSPATAPSAVAVGSVSATDAASPFSGRGPSPCTSAVFPTIAAYGEAISLQGPAGPTIVSGTSFAAPQVTGAVALLVAMYPGATPEALIDALVRGARDVGAPGADPDTGAGVVDVVRAAALLAGADHSGPRVSASARWSRDAAAPALLLAGRAEERGGGTGEGISATAFISLSGVPTAPFTLATETTDATSATLAGALAQRDVRRLFDGRHALFVRARDAAGNWGPARRVALPVDRTAPWLRVSHTRRGRHGRGHAARAGARIGPRRADLPRRARRPARALARRRAGRGHEGHAAGRARAAGTAPRQGRRPRRERDQAGLRAPTALGRSWWAWITAWPLPRAISRRFTG